MDITSTILVVPEEANHTIACKIMSIQDGSIEPVQKFLLCLEGVKVKEILVDEAVSCMTFTNIAMLLFSLKMSAQESS